MYSKFSIYYITILIFFDTIYQWKILLLYTIKLIYSNTIFKYISTRKILRIFKIIHFYFNLVNF